MTTLLLWESLLVVVAASVFWVVVIGGMFVLNEILRVLERALHHLYLYRHRHD